MTLRTEVAARQAWCPFTRTQPHLNADAAAKRGVTPERRAFNCIASACMAWRWVDPYGVPTPHRRIIAGKDDEADMREDPNQLGFCGLAGPTR